MVMTETFLIALIADGDKNLFDQLSSRSGRESFLDQPAFVSDPNSGWELSFCNSAAK